MQLELFFAVNLVEFVFLGLKLDGWVSWAWVVILIPLWILICLSVIGVLYAIVLAVLLLRSIELLPEHRRQHVFSAITYTFLVIPILIFLVLLTSKLDGSTQLPWLMVATPLYISLLCLILISCGTRGPSSSPSPLPPATVGPGRRGQPVVVRHAAGLLLLPAPRLPLAPRVRQRERQAGRQ